MKTFLYCEAGFVEKDQWLPNSWVNVECPTPEDIQYLLNQFHVPESFLSDIADTDERPRIEYEGNWLLTILRIPVQSKESGIPFTTVPIGIITNNEIIISVCYHKTELLPDFIRYSRRKELVVRHKYDLILRLIHSSAVWFLKYGLLQHFYPWKRSDALETAKHFPGTDVYGCGTAGRCRNRVKTGTPHGEHLQRYPYRNDGCFCLHHLQQREYHHEAHDLHLYYSDGTNADCQLLRNECGQLY